MKPELKHIPTNIITGFLGVGKTTSILHLLKNKPVNENWAVLVNEFGKIGIDGEILKHKGAEIKEIPGGCMCCAAGINMQVGLNALIKQARPDRLLIEPTGIGHPLEILKQLESPPYDQLLSMQACLCLIDAKHLSDERYYNNDTFNQQIEVADVLIANKSDTYNKTERDNFIQLLKNKDIEHSSMLEHGQISQDLLHYPHNKSYTQTHHHSHTEFESAITESAMAETALKDNESFKRLNNQSDGFYSCGWLFSNQCFDFDRILTLIKNLDFIRFKAVVITDTGDYWFNCLQHSTDMHKTQSLHNSRIEIISRDELDWQQIETTILSCLITQEINTPSTPQ